MRTHGGGSDGSFGDKRYRVFGRPYASCRHGRTSRESQTNGTLVAQADLFDEHWKITAPRMERGFICQGGLDRNESQGKDS